MKTSELTRKQHLVDSNENADLLSMSDDELYDALRESLSLSVKSIYRSACCVYELEDRGREITCISSGTLNKLRRIACGQLLPEIMVEFGGQPQLLGKLQNLPIPEQKAIASGEPLSVLTVDGNTITHRKVKPADMTPAEIRQVFGPDGIRNSAQQRGYLQTTAKPKARITEEAAEVKLDKRRGGIVVGERFVGKAELFRLLSQL